jgi:tRNA uridine 5-carbamoylmethylation protein Kti12
MSSSTSFGQIVIGPPGTGKTTYCDGMQQFLKSLGRNVILVNLGSSLRNFFRPYQFSDKFLPLNFGQI